MSEIISYCICIFILLIAIKDSVKKSLYEYSIIFALERLFYYFSIFITFLVIYFKVDIILNVVTNLILNNFKFGPITEDVFKIILLMCIFFIFQLSVYFLLRNTCIPIIRKRQNKKYIVFYSSIIGAIKGMVITLIIFMCIITYNNTLGYYNKIELFNNISIYNNLSSVVADKKVYLSEEMTEKILPSANIIIFYNGVTIEEGVQSTNEIDDMAIKLTENCKNEIEKARILYSWIGSNLEYDYQKAEKALNNEKLKGSGAITAWNLRSGICFDYSCLYVAMAKASRLKVRLVTGEAFDGKQYGPHAWNEVYISDEKKWIPVDTTFYLSGDYFNNYDFYDDHIRDNIAGEW